MVSSSSMPQPPKNVTVVLEISDGSFDDGFSVKLLILEDGRIIQLDDDLPDLPTAPNLPQLYQDWQNISLENSRKLQAVPAQVTNVATLETWKNAAQELEKSCRIWFKNYAFNSLRDRILANTRVNNDQSVPIIIKCLIKNNQHNEIIHRIPWHTWDLFTRLRNAEFALFTRFSPSVPDLSAPVRVLAIFGSSQGGLQLEKDEEALKLLEQRGATIIKKFEPDENTLDHLLFDQEWQILFFAGHSSSEGISGRIQISEGNCIELHTLRERLTSAITKGLKLAIFNSCDGLKIADFLGTLKLPAVIVMREPVPDRIAYQFLLYFLREFSQGTPLCLAVRKARDRLESLQTNFPAATWLPTVCLNPNQSEFVWPDTTDGETLTPIANPPPVPTIEGSQPTSRNSNSSLLSRWRFFPLRPQMMVRLATVAGIITVAMLIAIYRCQIFSSTCIEKFISSGQRSIADSKVQLSEPYLSLKRQGIEAFFQDKYDQAKIIFDNLRNRAEKNKSDPRGRKTALDALQDPEILIYRNNALVNLRHTQNPQSPIYTIAVAAPLNSTFGVDILFGVAQAQDVAVNQDNFNLQVVIANDNNNISQTHEVAEVLSNDDKILAVVGHYTSPNTCEALKSYSPKNLVVISPTSTIVNLRSGYCPDPNEVFYRTVSSTRIEAQTLVRYLVKDLNKLAPKVVVYYNPHEDFSKDLSEQFEQLIKTYNGHIIARFDLSTLPSNISNLQSEVNGADALVLLPDGGTNNSTALEKAIQIIKLNDGIKPILAANTLYEQTFLNKTNTAKVDSLFIAVDWHPKQCGAEKFRKEINKYWSGDLNRRTALAYEAVQAILQAIKQSDVSVNRKEIKQKLSATGILPNSAASSAAVEGLRISFDPQGNRIEITTRGIVTVKEVNNKRSFELVKDVPCPPK